MAAVAAVAAVVAATNEAIDGKIGMHDSSMARFSLVLLVSLSPRLESAPAPHGPRGFDHAPID